MAGTGNGGYSAWSIALAGPCETRSGQGENPHALSRLFLHAGLSMERRNSSLRVTIGTPTMRTAGGYIRLFTMYCNALKQAIQLA